MKYNYTTRKGRRKVLEALLTILIAIVEDWRNQNHSVRINLDGTVDFDFSNEDKIDIGMCFILVQVLDYPGSPIFDKLASLPELRKQRPEAITSGFAFWFPRDKAGFKKRIKVVEEAIELTYKH